MLRNVFTKTLWDSRRGLFGWAVALAAVTAMYASFYSSMAGTSADLLENFPDALKLALNMQDIASPEGYLGSTVFGILLPLLMVIFAVAMGARLLAGDEESGVLDLLLSYPLSRTRLLLQRAAAMTVAVTGLGLAVFVVLLAVSGPAELDVSAGRLAAAVTHLVLLGLSFGTLALALGAATGRKAVALGGAAALAVLTYIANAFGPQIDGAGWLRTLSPFHYYSGGQPLVHGLQLGDAGILLAVAAILSGIGIVTLNRRDLAV